MSSVPQNIRDKYTVTIGIECHVQLKTRTKLFSGVSNDARDAAPNTLISHICMGLPGALPVLNAHAVELASRAAFALKSSPAPFSTFDRKHYFYPDLPMGYQITQFYDPIIIGGEVQTMVNGKAHKVRIARAHLEADAGKSSHPAGAPYSLVDLNRAGTPLLEIVSEPDIHSPAEARAYAHELYLLMKYADVSDADLFHGNMRFDVNVSVSTTKDLGIRTETKNLNSFKSVEKAAEYEINRQISVLERGEKVDQETRGWDDATQKTTSQRGKEQAHDYRYMPDPDLPPVQLDNDFIEEVKKSLPLMPDEWRNRLSKLGLDASQIDILLEAEVDASEIAYLGILQENLSDNTYAKQLANWFVNIEIPYRKDEANNPQIIDSQKPNLYKAVYAMTSNKKLSSTAAKNLIQILLDMDELPTDIEAFAEKNGLVQVSNSDALESIVDSVIADNQQAVQDVQNGEMKALGFLVGQMMKLSQGKANPSVAQELLKKKILP
jgi:aspartyl-tRNA(Asn)/glutamyl-tRNA(Gln) amidotransferase subunit B